MKIVYRVVLLILIFSTSCKKDDDSIGLSERSAAILGQWEYGAITADRAVDINGDGTVNIDLFNTQELQQCVKDDLTFFTEMGVSGSGVYSINENGLACDNQDSFSTIEEDTYELINNSIIRFGTRNEMRIQELSKTKLVIETNDNLGGEDVVLSITYNKS